MKFSDYTNKNIEEVFEELKTSGRGLPEEEAVSRLKIYGSNEIKIKEAGLLDIFLRQFSSPFFYLLIIAAIVAFFVGEKIDSFTIISFVIINVSLGFFQEARAVRTIALLKKYIPLKTRVRRNDIEIIINQEYLVPGDIVLLEPGNIIPADLRIIKTNNFLIDESILSGESAPVYKIIQPIQGVVKDIFEAKNIGFGGTSVISGEAEGVVMATGMNTFFGEVSKLTGEISKESDYQKNLIYFSKIIIRIVTGTIAIIFILNLILKSTHDLFIFLIFCIALVVSIVPEALPVVVTFAFSQGALRLTKKKVIVKRLSAIEDLGDIDILCTDKTGTLTENRLSLDGIFSKNKEECLFYGLLSCYFTKEENESFENPFDTAIFDKITPGIKERFSDFRLVSKIHFDPFRLRSSICLEEKGGKKLLIVKGAPEVILGLSLNYDNEEIRKEIDERGMGGKRILAIAIKNLDRADYGEEDEKSLTFLGYFSLIDPLKETAKETINLAKELGIKIKILTGDSKETAGYVAKEIGLIDDPKKVILGKELDSLSEEDFKKSCEEFSVFARISPQIKYRIINFLRKKFEVGFLGEGINDAPALKEANVAISVKEGTDISRAASDIVLLEKDLRVIIDGIKEGRNIFLNINKYIKCISASNFGNFYSIAAISLFVSFLPMLPIQILLGNLLSDFPLIAISTDQVDVEELKKPKLYQLNHFISLIICLALVSTAFDFIFFAIFYKSSPATIQTLWFIESIMTEILLIFSIRTRRFFLKAKRPSFTLIALTILDAIFIISLPFTGFGREIFHFILPPLGSILIVFSLLIGYFIISELVKLLYFHFWRYNNTDKSII